MSDQQTLPIDPESISLDELREAANVELQKERDEKGRFLPKSHLATALQEQAQQQQQPEEDEIFVARREIDLGDGSGVQVFEAEGDSKESALEALADKVTEAQANATKKIRQQEAELKELRSKTAEKPKSADFSDDEKYVLKQEFDKDPDAALRGWFKRRTGRDIEDITALGQRLDAEAETRQKFQAMETFLATHDDFINDNQIEGKMNPNGDLMRMKLAELGLPVTSENLHKAYLQLKQSGLLRLKGSEANADTTPTSQPTERIAQARTETTQTRTRGTTSGISSHGRPAARPAEPSEADAYNMPMDKLRELANRQLQTR